VADICADKLAEDIIVLDVRALTTIADYFVICSGNSERQVRAVSRQLLDALSQDGVKPLHGEGESDSNWVLLDYGDVIVHVFTPQERDYYRLERLWSAAVTVLRMQ
jgi:ribosome-associated protein